MEPYIGCTIKELRPDQIVEAAKNAIEHNPANDPQPMLRGVLSSLMFGLSEAAHVVAELPLHMAVVTGKRWANGTTITVAFMEQTPSDLANRILSHMSAWSEFCNIKFALSTTDPMCRISRQPGGYYSYLGTDNLSIPRNQQTMNLEAFTMQTPESEFHRVVRHETGHLLSAPHSHSRKEIVDLLDPEKTVAYFQATQGWSRQEIIAQILQPLNEATLTATLHENLDGIMVYGFPGSITRNGKPIPGGTDITKQDADFMASIYPKAIVPPSPPVVPPSPPAPPSGPHGKVTCEADWDTLTATVGVPSAEWKTIRKIT